MELSINKHFRRTLSVIRFSLKYTRLSVAEIAYQLSFEDAAYFNRFFKQHTGVAPASFRNIK